MLTAAAGIMTAVDAHYAVLALLAVQDLCIWHVWQDCGVDPRRLPALGGQRRDRCHTASLQGHGRQLSAVTVPDWAQGWRSTSQALTQAAC